MENASKALIMAGGILIALLIIGALLLMFNQIGDYEKGQQTNEKTSQLVQFNTDFERYTDDNGINGTDIISLINKVIDYNKKASRGGVANSVDYNIKMSITISGLDKFNKKYAYDKEKDKDSLFPKSEYKFDATAANNDLKNLFDNFAANEGTIGIDNLKKLSSIYNGNNDRNTNIANIKEKLLEIDANKYKNWNGTTPAPTLDAIKKYRQYSEFKSSKFVISQNPVYENGQIRDLYFKFSK